MLEGTIEEREGALFVRYETTFEFEPIRRVMLWRVIRTDGNPYHAARPKRGDIARSQGMGVWRTFNAVTNDWTGSVTIDGAAEAEYVEDVEVPAPKVRKGVELRWHRGRWEKLLRKGWVPA